MTLVSVPVPKRPKIIRRGGIEAILLKFGRGEEKVSAHLVAPRPRRFSGRRVVCLADITQMPKANGALQATVKLTATGRTIPTHGLPFMNDKGQIDFAVL